MSIIGIFHSIKSALIGFATWLRDAIEIFFTYIKLIVESFSTFLYTLVKYLASLITYNFSKAFVLILQNINESVPLQSFADRFTQLYNSLPHDIIAFATLLGIPEAITIIITGLTIRFILSWIPL